MTRAAAQRRVGVDRSALPPAFFRSESEYGEMQMGGVRRGVSTGADVAEQIATAQRHAFAQAVGVALEMGVVVGVSAGRIELVNRHTTAHAPEKLDKLAVIDSENFGPARRGNVDGLVTIPQPPSRESGLKVARLDAVHRQRQPALYQEFIVLRSQRRRRGAQGLRRRWRRWRSQRGQRKPQRAGDQQPIPAPVSATAI